MASMPKTPLIQQPKPPYSPGEWVDWRRGPFDGWSSALVRDVRNEADVIGDFWVVEVATQEYSAGIRHIVCGPDLEMCLQKKPADPSTATGSALDKLAELTGVPRRVRGIYQSDEDVRAGIQAEPKKSSQVYYRQYMARPMLREDMADRNWTHASLNTDTEQVTFHTSVQSRAPGQNWESAEIDHEYRGIASGDSLTGGPKISDYVTVTITAEPSGIALKDFGTALAPISGNFVASDPALQRCRVERHDGALIIEADIHERAVFYLFVVDNVEYEARRNGVDSRVFVLGNPMDVTYDDVKLCDLLKHDQLMREGSALAMSLPPAWLLYQPGQRMTSAQRAAVSRHWSEQLRAKVKTSDAECKASKVSVVIGLDAEDL